MNIRIYLLAGALYTPLHVNAQINNIQGLLRAIGSLINILIPIAIAAGLLFFLWGVARFISQAGDEKAREEGKRIMVWGIVSLFVMVSVWGIIRFFQTSFFGSMGTVPTGEIEAEPPPPFPPMPPPPPLPPPGL